MRVQELMTREVKTCHRGTNLAEAASMLWENDCGTLPVVDDENKIVGMISDRDICFAVATKGRLASEIAVGEITSGRPVYTCLPESQIQEALATMQQRQVRRLPIVNRENKIIGILSISDVVLAAQAEPRGNVSNQEAISTLKAICEQRFTKHSAATPALSAARL